MLTILHEVKAHLPLVVDKIQLTDNAAVECVVTCGLDGDNMFIERIHIDNRAGTGWMVWDWQNVRRPAADDFSNLLGQKLFAAAYADEQLRSDFRETVLLVEGCL